MLNIMKVTRQIAELPRKALYKRNISEFPIYQRYNIKDNIFVRRVIKN